jgi:hypothetical protein
METMNNPAQKQTSFSNSREGTVASFNDSLGTKNAFSQNLYSNPMKENYTPSRISSSSRTERTLSLPKGVEVRTERTLSPSKGVEVRVYREMSKGNSPAFFKSFMLSLAIFVAGIGSVFGQCTHTIQLTDTYGDGWNGGAVSVSVNGTVVLTNITLSSGSGPANFTFTASAGQTIRVYNTTAGSYLSERRIRVNNPAGTAVINTVQPVNGTASTLGSTGSASCPTALPGENCSNPINLGTLTSPISATTVGYANDIATCRTGYADRVYYIDVVNGATITFQEITNNYDEYEYIGYGSSCTATTQIQCWDNDGLAATTWTNSTGSTQRVWYVQDAYSGSGTFTLSWTVVAPLPPPTITSISPTSGCPGTTITINGSNLTGATAANVRIGGTPVTAILTNTATQITATIGSGTTGVASVITTGGTANGSQTFTVNATPAAPTANAATATTTTTSTANWSASVGATQYFLDVSTSNVFASFVGVYNNLNVGNVTSASITGLTANTTYYYRVRASNGSCASLSSGTISFFTGYCIPTTATGCSVGDLIASVQLNTLTNVTGTTCTAEYNNYSANPALTTTLLPSSSYTVTIGSGAYSQNYAVWIDYNDDLVFDNATERVGYTTSTLAANSTASFTITLACNPPAGNHRMRVRSAYGMAGENITPCANQTWGEIEDYLITISAAPACPNPGIITTVTPSFTSVALSWNAGCATGTSYDFQYGPQGFTIGSGTTVTNQTVSLSGGVASFTLSGLTSNTQYSVYYRANCGGSTSSWSLVSNFATLCTPTGDETSFGNGSWIGYVYNSASAGAFTTYKGTVTEAETFNTSHATTPVGATTNLCLGTNSDLFAIRYKMTKNFPAGDYIFTVGGDDGVRLSVDGGTTWLINNWIDQGYTQSSNAVPVSLNGSTNLVFEFYENTSNAQSSFAYALAPVPTCATYTSPADGSTGQVVNPSLTWGAVANATSYDVYIGVGSLPSTPTATVTGTSYSAICNGLTTYMWKVVPKNAQGEATGCATWSFATMNVDYATAWISANTGNTWWCQGETRTVTVTVKNNGAVSWIDAGADNYNIGVKWNGDSDYNIRVDAQNLAAGATGTFTFTVTAPTAGNNNLTFDVVKEGPFWFGTNSNGAGPGNVTYSTVANVNNTYPTTNAGADNAVCLSQSVTLSGTAGVSAPALSNVLAAINANVSTLTASIPTPYGFTMDMGVNSNFISDGGGDMYDGGNYINTNLASNITYSDNTVVSSASFGTGGKYFTRAIGNMASSTTVPTIFYWAADLNGVSSVSVTGNNGADGSGTQNINTFTVTSNNVTYNCFLKRVYGATDPSINQLFIVPQPNSITTAMGATTDDNLFSLSGLSGVTRMYYMLYAGNSGTQISVAQATSIAQTFANVISATATVAWSSNPVGFTSTSNSPVVTPTAATTTYTLAATYNGCTTTDNVVITANTPTITVTPTAGSAVWRGASSTDWTTASNWYAYDGTNYTVATATPISSSNVIIPANQGCVTQQPAVASGTVNANNLTVETGAALTMGTSSVLNVAGNFTINGTGTFTPGTGTVNFTGGNGVTQVVTTGTQAFNNVTVSGFGTVQMTGNTTINGNFLNSDGTLDMNDFNLTVGGNYANYNSMSGLLPGIGTVIFNKASGTQTVDQLALDFNHIQHTGAGTLQLISDLSTTGDIINSAGTFDANDKIITVRNDFTNTATFTPGTEGLGEIYFEKSGGTQTLTSGGAVFQKFAHTGTGTLNLAGIVEVKGDVVIDAPISAGTSTMKLSGTNDQSIGSSAQATGAPSVIALKNMEVEKTTAAGTVTLSKPVKVDGTLTMTRGNIITSLANKLEIGSSTSSLGLVDWTDGNVVGPMRRWFAGATNSGAPTGIFPVGLSNVNRYAQINFTAAPGSGGYIDMEYKAGAPITQTPWTYLTTPDGQLIQNYENEGYWDITPYDEFGDDYPSELNNSAFTLKLRAKGLASINDISVTRIIRSPGPDHTTWEPAGFHLASSGQITDFAIESNSVTGFSWFNIGAPNNQPLPVELLNFNGTCEEGMVNLVWQTASEFNSSHFDVEKSTDGETWRVLATIPSAGTSNELLTYQTVDNNGTNGSNYYRLRQVDIDGKEKLYDPINVSCVETTVGYFTSYPNPSGNEFQVIVNNKEILGACTLNIVDAQGKVIDQRSIEVKDGINMFVISEKLTPGIYFLNITNGTKTTQVIKHAVK